MEHREWLASLKVGDKVAVSDTYDPRLYNFYTIESESKKFWKLSGNRGEVTKEHGTNKGRAHWSDHWCIMQPNEAMVQYRREIRARRELADLDWKTVPHEELYACVDIIRNWKSREKARLEQLAAQQGDGK